MHVLVTGGLGYIGHAVTADLMAHGHRVSILSRGSRTDDALTATKGEVILGDLLERERLEWIVREGNFDSVVHLAGLARPRESFEDPLSYFDVNIGGTANLLRAIDTVDESRRPSFIYASTTLVYGARHAGAISEMVELAPESPYAETKVATERMITAHANTGRLAATVLRIFNVGGAVAGVGDIDHSRIIPNLLRVAAGDMDLLTLVGNGIGVRDFVHVADVASAVRYSIYRVRPGACPAYNVGSGVGTRIIDVVNTVREVTQREVKIDHLPQEGAPSHIVADISQTTSQLDWVPYRSDIKSIVSDAWNCWAKD